MVVKASVIPLLNKKHKKYAPDVSLEHCTHFSNQARSPRHSGIAFARRYNAFEIGHRLTSDTLHFETAVQVPPSCDSDHEPHLTQSGDVVTLKYMHV